MKKVLSFVLVLSLVLSSISMAFAGEAKTTGLSDIAGNANEDAIRVVNDLGIVTGYTDGTFKGEKAVNRAEFAVMLTKALAVPESALAGFKATSFTDVTGYEWAIPYLAFCESKGIMSGYGDGTVKPGKTIDVSEAVTMVCRALGYMGDAKELVGTWPANYVSLAQNLGLYDDVAAVATVDRASAAQLVYNALTVEQVYIDVEGRTVRVLDADGNTTNMLVTLGGDVMLVGAEDEFILTSVMADTAVININEHVGALVSAYVNDDNDIIAIEVLSTFLDGEYDAADGVFVVDDTEYYITAAVAAGVTSATAVTNGVTSYTYALADGDETVLAVDLSGKTIKEVYSRVDWTQDALFLYEEDMLEDEFLNGYEFKKNDNGEIDTNTFALLGAATLADIDVDDVVVVYTAGGYITRVEVGTEVVEGTISQVAADGSSYFIDGVEYDANEDVDGDALVLGDKGTASLTYGGEIGYWEVDEASAGNYAVVIATKASVETWSDEDSVYSIKLLDKNGNTVTAVVEDEVTSDAMALAKGTLVEFSLNKDGELNDIDTVATAPGAGKLNEKATRIGTTPLANNVLLFVQDDDGDWAVGDVNSIDRDIEVSVLTVAALFATNTDGEIEVIVAQDDIYGEEASYGVIHTITGKVDEDGDNYIFLTGFLDGKEFAAYTDIAYTVANVATFVSDNDLDNFDHLYEITVDGDGIVTGLTVAGIEVASFADEEITKVNSTKMEISTGSTVYGLTDDVVVYVWNEDTERFELGKIADLKKAATTIYQTDADFDGCDIAVVW